MGRYGELKNLGSNKGHGRLRSDAFGNASVVEKWRRHAPSFTVTEPNESGNLEKNQLGEEPP